MNFISQTLSNLTSGGKLYIGFQLFYLVGALFFTYVQLQILQQLKQKEAEVLVHSCVERYYLVTYFLDETTGRLKIFSNSKEGAERHLKSIYRDAIVLSVE
jgi:hypothetical protein